VVHNLDTTVPTLPRSEAVARPLTRLEPEEQREAWKIATEINANWLGGNFPESVFPSNNQFEMLGSSSGQVYGWLGGKFRPAGDVVDRIQKLVDVK
jgi:hypothetical protein